MGDGESAGRGGVAREEAEQGQAHGAGEGKRDEKGECQHSPVSCLFRPLFPKKNGGRRIKKGMLRARTCTTSTTCAQLW